MSQKSRIPLDTNRLSHAAWLVGVVLVLFAAPAAPMTSSPGTAAEAGVVLDEVLVTGERPGPGMWRVSNGSHNLWILATLEPLPKNMQWRSQAVEGRIAASQQVLAPPRVRPDIGFFRGLTLLPSLLRARKSPDGQVLEQVLPHTDYIRWLALRVKFLGNSSSDEQKRPMLAALDLYTHALDASGLTAEETVWATVERFAGKLHVPIVPVTIEIKLSDPKASIRSLAEIPRDAELACLEKTMERLETDLQPMRQRANLWSLGDIQGLRASPYPDERIACMDAFYSVPKFRDQMQQAKQQLADAWLTAAASALANKDSTVAVLPLTELLDSGGFLAKLRTRGYSIEEPTSSH